jgi:Ser/Thr protein kinase RdoA (MazF antagonist)
MTEQRLAGGNVADAVVRVGDTVRKPATVATPAVHALLEHLSAVGFDGSPRSLGRDERGRHVLEFVPGEPVHGGAPLTPAELLRVGRLVRDLHDAVQDFRPPPDAAWQVALPADREELICHHDLAPWNLIRSGTRFVVIDWDGAGPGTRLWDLGYAAHGFVPLGPGGDPALDGVRFRALADGYGLDADQRRALPASAEAHTRAMYQLLRTGAETGRQPWARLWREGHGDHWGPAADYIGAHLEHWTQALLG